MKAILIDPVAKSVTEVDFSYSSDDDEQLKHLLSDPDHGLNFKNTAYALLGGRDDIVFVDGAGRDALPKYFFRIESFGVCAGRGLIVGGDPGAHDLHAPQISLQEARRLVSFPMMLALRLFNQINSWLARRGGKGS